MQRKIIQQSASSVGISLPSKWCSKWNLKKGDSIELIENTQTITIQPIIGSKQKKVLRFDIIPKKESVLRMFITNAYRSGADIINITYEGKDSELSNIIETQMIGFEITKKDNKSYVLESVADPEKIDFNSIIQKQFFIILEMMSLIDKENLSSLAKTVQKYDNFLKRGISKRIFPVESDKTLWYFLSMLTRISRYCYYMNKKIIKSKSQNKTIALIMEEIKRYFEKLHKAYLKKNLDLLSEIHHEKETMTNLKNMKIITNKDTQIFFYIMAIIDSIYYATSPLSEIITREHVSKDVEN